MNYKKMKITIKSILTIALVMGLGFIANAQKTSSAPASATVLADLTIALDGAQNEIAFGNLSATTLGAVVLDANGTANANTGVATNVARFNLSGANSGVTVSYDAYVTLTNGNQANDMTMTPEVVGANDFTNQAQAGATAVASSSQVALPVSGLYYLWVGGSIPTLATQATGVYSGTFNIDVEYN
jgi:hypothetical protein